MLHQQLGMLSLPYSHWLIITGFLNYNIGELQVTSEVNIVSVSTAFTIGRCFGNKSYFKLLECTELCYTENVTSHVHRHSEGYQCYLQQALQNYMRKVEIKKVEVGWCTIYVEMQCLGEGALLFPSSAGVTAQCFS